MLRKEPDQKTSISVDQMKSSDALSAMLASQVAAAQGAASCIGPIAEGAARMANALSTGHRLHYAAAGSSALMALSDACELPGTFGIAQDQIVVSMAGGVPTDGVMPGDVEDDAEAAIAAAQSVAEGDVCIVVSASGTTPYAIAFAETAHARGGAVIAIANAADAPLLQMSDVAIALPTAPEVVEGSTRLGAGTAQKVVLNMMSTQIGILLGHVYDGQMINLKADNIKLRKRAGNIVTKITGASTSEAAHALQRADYDTKLAVLIASGQPIDEARSNLQQSGGRLADCITRQDHTTETT